MRGHAAYMFTSARRSLRQFPLLPATVTFLLLGLSVYASIQSTYQRFVGHQSTPARELRSTTAGFGGFDYVANATPPVPVPKVTCDIATVRYRGSVVKTGAENLKPSADACLKSCRHTPGCNSWVWCEDHRGCKDERGNTFPQQGCHLKREAMDASGVPADRLDKQRSKTRSQHTMGFVKHQNATQMTFIRSQSIRGTKMLIATYMPTEDCSTTEGSQVAQMSILNKRDYARWHSYSFHVATETADPELRPSTSPDEGSWNTVGVIRKLLDAYQPSEVEWILWMEPDSLFDDPSFKFPFEFYQGKDIICVGDYKNALQGNAVALSTGIMLFRNSQWTRELMADLADYAKQLGAEEEEKREGEVGSDPVASAMMAIMKRRGLNDSLTHFRMEGEFCLACDWRRIDLKLSSQVKQTTVWGEENRSWKLFITRFFDCEICTGGGIPDDTLSACFKSFKEHYEFAYCRFHRISQAIRREYKEGSVLQQLEQQQIPDQGFNFTAFNIVEPIDRLVLVSPQQLHTATSQECFEACIAEIRCGRWIWCSHSEGCDEMGAFRGNFPFKGCQLTVVDMKQSPYEWNRGPQFSSFASGYIPGDHPSRMTWAGRFTRKPSSSTQRMVIATGLPTAPCSTPYGDLLLRLAVENRQDYVRLHAQEFHLMTEAVDPNLRMGAWQKLGFMKKLLVEVPRERAEWIVWMDMDIIIDNMHFEIPLSKYKGKDFVLWGVQELISQGDVLNGVNSGVFLVRNTDWSRSFLESWTPFGAFPAQYKYDEMLRSSIKNFDIGMFEQNVIAYLVMQQPELLDHMEFEKDFCINCWYKDAFKPHIPQPPFVVHFAGCQVCAGFHPEKLGDCDREMVRLYVDSHAQTRAIVTAANSKTSSLLSTQ